MPVPFVKTIGLSIGSIRHAALFFTDSVGVWFRAAHDGPGDRRHAFVQEGAVMSVIKPRTRGERLIKHNMRLDEEN